MKELFEDVAVEKFTVECSLMYSSFIYCLMVNRIARRYSSMELSFLLGQEDDFIDNIERVKVIDFSIDLYGQLCKVFRHTSFVHHQYHGEKDIKHEMHVWKAGGTIFYRMECYKSVYESIVLFQLTEEDPNIAAYRYKNSVERYQSQSQEILKIMLENDLFKNPISSLELHRLIENTLKSQVYPIHFKTELEKLVGRKGKAPLKRTKRRSYGYRYMLHPDVDIPYIMDFINQNLISYD